MPISEEFERASLESAALERALTKVHSGPTAQTTPESLVAGDAFIAAAYTQAPAQFQQRVENKELLTAEEFCDALGLSVDWFDVALQDSRVFALTSPTGRSHYPALHADVRLNRADVESVVQVLALVDATSPYTFFYRTWTRMGTTLDALRAGRLEDVLRMAIGFVEDAPERFLAK